MALFEFIGIPVSHILSEFDSADTEARLFTRNALKKVLVSFDIPNSKHLVNDENPVDLLDSIINQRVVSNPKYPACYEHYLIKRYGSNYRELLSNKRLGEILENGPVIPKL